MGERRGGKLGSESVFQGTWREARAQDRDVGIPYVEEQVGLYISFLWLRQQSTTNWVP